MTDKHLQLQQQILHRQILALSVIGASVVIMFGALLASFFV